MVRFFLKVFLLSFTAIACSWFIEGAFYSYYYSHAPQAHVASEFILPRPAAVQALIKDTNFLLLGMSGKPYPAPFLTDTIIVGQFKADPGTLTLTSIPRDLMVRVPGGNQIVKINSLYELGQRISPLAPEQLIKKKIEQMSGLSIDYHAVIDVAGLEKIIDALGGVDIEVKKAINDPSFPGPNYSYEPFYLAAGMHHLNGHDAVRFARSRHSTRGDFDRIQRQQELLDTLKQKAITQGISAQTALTIFNDLASHLTTNVTVSDIPSLLATVYEFSHSIIKGATIDNGAEGLLKSSHAASGAYILLPRKGLEHYEDIQQFFAQQL